MRGSSFGSVLDETGSLGLALECRRWPSHPRGWSGSGAEPGSARADFKRTTANGPSVRLEAGRALMGSGRVDGVQQVWRDVV